MQIHVFGRGFRVEFQMNASIKHIYTQHLKKNVKDVSTRTGPAKTNACLR